MRIAFLTPRFPYPIISGGRLRAHHILRHLLRSHEVTLYGIGSPLRAHRELGDGEPEGLKKRLFRLSPADFGWNGVKGLFSHLPFQVKLYEDGELLRALTADVERGQIDLLFVQLLRMAEYALPFGHIPCILDMVDSICLHYRRMPPAWHSPRWWAARADRERVCRYEAKLPGQFKAVLLSSPVDLAWVRERTGADNLVLVPNGVELDTSSVLGKRPEANTVIFVGKLDYLPNADAAVYFARQILPLVRNSVPDVRFLVVGWNPSRAVRALGRMPGVTVRANVPDVRVELIRSAVSVAPLRFGAGTQYKVLESLAVGVPVVATPGPARALVDDATEPILVGRNPEEFAHQVVRLLTDATLRERLGRASRSLVELQYTWGRALAPLDRVLEGIESPTRVGLSAAAPAE